MTECRLFDDFDAEMKAEREVVDKLFALKKSRDTTISERQEQVHKLAASLFVNHFDPEQRDEVLFGPGCCGDVVAEYLNKAEKVYELCGDFETSKKCLRFLQAVDPKLSQEIVAKL